MKARRSHEELFEDDNARRLNQTGTHDMQTQRFGETSMPAPRQAYRQSVAPAARIKSIYPKKAWELLQAWPGALLIDVRSSAEFLFVGHPVGAVHIPWMDEPDWTVNPDFARQVGASIAGTGPGIQPDTAVVLLICRSGKRSLEAERMLVDAGFEDIYNVSTGFEGDLDHKHQRGTVNGWRFDGLPWEQC